NKDNKIGTVKAYSWHDAIEHIKDNFFHNRNENLNINCEKDFAYLEEKHESIIGDNRDKGENLFGFAIYLNTKRNESGSLSRLSPIIDSCFSSKYAKSFSQFILRFSFRLW